MLCMYKMKAYRYTVIHSVWVVIILKVVEVSQSSRCFSVGGSNFLRTKNSISSTKLNFGKDNNNSGGQTTGSTRNKGIPAPLPIHHCKYLYSYTIEQLYSGETTLEASVTK